MNAQQYLEHWKQGEERGECPPSGTPKTDTLLKRLCADDYTGLEECLRRLKNHAREQEIENNHLRAEITILKETHENQMDIIEKLHECRDVRRFEAIQMEIDGYLDGAPDASAASKLAGRISAILKPMDAPAEPSNEKAEALCPAKGQKP
jgi:folylpolyglutamate synthase/dihydropteroate synthase